MFKLKFNQWWYVIIPCQNKITNVKEIVGDSKKSRLLFFTLSNDSLLSNFNPSRSGCKIPFNLVLFTPIRVWLSPRTFRSNNV